MKRTFKISMILLSLMLLCLFIISCGDNDPVEPNTDISVSTEFAFVDGTFEAVVASSVESYSLLSKIEIANGATIIASKSDTFDERLNMTQLSLEHGNNIFYVKVVDENSNEQTFTFNIIRKRLLTVQFNTNGGSEIADILVDSGTIIEAPQSIKTGYELKWDYDFSTPISSDMIVNAVWTAKNYQILIKDGDEIVDTIDVSYDGDYNLSESIPQKTGYRFNGFYYLDGDVELAFTTEGKYTKAQNTTVYAKYELVEYSITYVVDKGASHSNVDKFTIDSVVNLLPASWSNDEKIFAGWYLSEDYSEDSKITTIFNCAENITLYAKFQDREFKTNIICIVDGAPYKTYEFTYKDSYTLIPPTVKKGYVFDGWYYNDTKLESNSIWQYKLEEIELVAKITARQNDIEYVLPEGAVNSTDNPTEYNADKGVITLSSPSYGKHIFIGWYSDAEYNVLVRELSVDTVAEEMTLYSKWQYVSGVTFDANGGRCDTEYAEYQYEKEYTLPVPQLTDYIFGGWYYGGDKVLNGTWEYTHDVELVAHWVPSTIAINYELNGGIQNSQNPQTFDVYTGIITLKDPTNKNTDLLFAGWYTDIDFKNKITQIDTAVVREITLYAKWIGTNISVSFDANSGYVAGTSQTIVYGSTYSLNIPERVGYTFDGWYYNGQKVDNVGTWTIISDNITLVARWIPEEYKIEYDLGGATEGDIYDLIINDDGTTTKQAIALVDKYYADNSETIIPKLYRDGYIFLGWNTGNGLAQKVTISSGSTGNRKYTAVWCADTNDDGFVFALEDDHMVCVGFTREPDSKEKIDMPSDYAGYPVTAIAKNAFSDFGVKFGKSSYKNANYYFTITIPKTITVIQTDAFINCNGICVSLRDDNGTLLDFQSAEELKEWEKSVSYSSGKINKQVRDCIWGFRPAIGWTRFSAVQIPDDYE
ncbi:MAG: InlB B-repeat-containing protein [Clostridia bacterium]|nr:InlB B-repeat-containing protein [Clostridia bacterium]